MEEDIQGQEISAASEALYHRSDEGIVGHIEQVFWRLEMDMRRKMEDRGIAAPRVEMMRELQQVQTGEVEVEGKRYTFQTKVVGYARESFIATGTRIPSRTEEIEELKGAWKRSAKKQAE